MSAFPKYTLKRMDADGAVLATPCTIYGVLLMGTGNSKAEFTNDADGSGTNVLEVLSLANDSFFLDLSEVGGVPFDTKCYLDITGTAAVCFVWYNAQ